MKIIFVTAKYYPDGAGAGRSVHNLAGGVSQAGHEVVVVRLSDEKTPKQEMRDGVKIYHLPIRNIYGLNAERPINPLKRLFWHIIDSCNIGAARDLGAILDVEKPDIVNTNIIAGFSPSIFAEVKERDIKLVHTLRDYYLLCPQSGMFKNGKSCESICAPCKPFAMMRANSACHVDLFLGNSSYILERHKSLGAIGKAQNSAVQFNMNDDDKIAGPKKHEQETIRFGFIGRLNKTKGLEVLLKASQSLRNDNWTLKIAGKGNADYTAKLKSQASDPRIEFLGHVPADEFYKDIDILICPSLYAEPLPRVVFEAYRAAIPVIAAHTGGTPEIIDEAVTGFTYDAHDVEALAALMDKLAADPALYETLSKGAAQKAKLFPKNVITTQFIAHLDNVMKAE